jgi:hypothetical protein
MINQAMTKIIILAWILSLSAYAQTSPLGDTVRFKFSPYQFRGIDPLATDIILQWYRSNPKNPKEYVVFSAIMAGDKYDDVWLWQTYAFYYAKDYRLISPKLPKGCELINLGIGYSNNKFNISGNFKGLPCKALEKSFKVEKFHIQYIDVPVIDENTIKEKVDLIIDDLPQYVRTFDL